MQLAPRRLALLDILLCCDNIYIQRPIKYQPLEVVDWPFTCTKVLLLHQRSSITRGRGNKMGGKNPIIATVAQNYTCLLILTHRRMKRKHVLYLTHRQKMIHSVPASKVLTVSQHFPHSFSISFLDLCCSLLLYRIGRKKIILIL